MNCTKVQTTVSLSTRLGSVVVECSLLVQCMQELSQQVAKYFNQDTVMSVNFSKQLDGDFSAKAETQVGCLATQWLPGYTEKLK